MFVTVYTCVFTHNGNAYEVTSGSHNYLTFGHHICSFTFVAPLMILYLADNSDL